MVGVLQCLQGWLKIGWVQRWNASAAIVLVHFAGLVKPMYWAPAYGLESLKGHESETHSVQVEEAHLGQAEKSEGSTRVDLY